MRSSVHLQVRWIDAHTAGRNITVALHPAVSNFQILKGNPNAFDTADNGLLSRALHLLSGFSALQGGAVDMHCSMLVGHSVAM